MYGSFGSYSYIDLYWQIPSQTAGCNSFPQASSPLHRSRHRPKTQGEELRVEATSLTLHTVHQFLTTTGEHFATRVEAITRRLKKTLHRWSLPGVSLKSSSSSGNAHVAHRRLVSPAVCSRMKPSNGHLKRQFSEKVCHERQISKTRFLHVDAGASEGFAGRVYPY